MGGSSELAMWCSMIGLFYHLLEFLAGVDSDNTACRDRYFFAGLGITAGALRFVAQLEIAEAGKFDALPSFQLHAYLLEERFYHVFCFTLVQANLFKQQIGQFSLGQCCHILLLHTQLRAFPL